MKKKHLFILAGEQSGDLHASHLVKAMTSSDYHFSGVAGPLMRAEGVENIMPMEKFSVMGFSDVLKAFPALYRQFYFLRDHILKTQPHGVVFVDYPGLNLRMAKALRKAGYKGKLVHYICPSVWAWGKKRIDTMASTLDMLLTIYPFESESFSHTSLKVQYIGNPLKEYISKHPYCDHWKEQFPIGSKTLIALFPGSRLGEIQRNLAKQLQAALLFQKRHPEAVFGISCSNAQLKPFIDSIIARHDNLKAFTVLREYTYELMRDSHSAIAKSGTVTLELALHKRPTVVVYELSILNWFIAKYLIRLNLPHYCIVNILNQQRVFPELIASGFEPENLSIHLENIYSGKMREEGLKGCERTIELLQKDAASQSAAKAIRELIT
jgi:lipid-A-disaccharide synthase